VKARLPVFSSPLSSVCVRKQFIFRDPSEVFLKLRPLDRFSRGPWRTLDSGKATAFTAATDANF
jgi:hypothetical protein